MGKQIRGQSQEASASFFAKKEAKKTLICWGLWQQRRQRPQEQTFFVSFFQKRSSCFSLGTIFAWLELGFLDDERISCGFGLKIRWEGCRTGLKEGCWSRTG
jgi:hypothetical protein